MKKYLTTKQEMDKILEDMVRPHLAGSPNVFDAGCGVGHLIRLLAEMNPRAQFLGVDQTDYLIEEARKLNADEANVAFEVGDILDLPMRYPKQFDLSIIWKTLSWLPYYEDAVRALVAVTKRHIFLSSLFYDGDIDFEIKIREYEKEAGKDGFNAYYNIYSLPKFQRFLAELGASHLEVRDFEMPIDLPRPSPNQMGTYTVSLADGRRLQMSGALALPWKIIRIDV